MIMIDDCYLSTSKSLNPEVEFVEAVVLNDDYPIDVDVVFNIAALSSQNMHEFDSQRSCRVNVEGFVNTVKRARNAGCDAVVYASTSSIYNS